MKKINIVGNPRVDLWSWKFKDYWGAPKNAPESTYVLVSSNFGIINNYSRFWEFMGKLDANGYLKRVDGTEAFFEAASESFKLFWAFVKVVRKLAESYPNLIIVIRPHPAEDPASWTTFFKDYSNVLIIREDNISAWVNNSLCVIHHGCTTAIEAEVAGIPIITFVPFEAVTANKISNSFVYLQEMKMKLLTMSAT